MATKWSNPEFAKFRKKYEKDDILCHQSDTDRQLFVLLEGVLNVFVGGRRIAEIKEPGSFLGEMSFLSGRPRTATVKTADTCLVLLFDYSIVQQLVDLEMTKPQVPSITVVMLDTVVSRYEKMKTNVEAVQSKLSARQKIYQEIFNSLRMIYEKKLNKSFYEIMDPDSEDFPQIYHILKEIETDPLFTTTSRFIEVEDSALNVVRSKPVANIIPKMRVELAKRICNHLTEADEKLVNMTSINLEIRDRCKNTLEKISHLYHKTLRLPELKNLHTSYKDRLELQ